MSSSENKGKWMDNIFINNEQQEDPKNLIINLTVLLT